LPGPELTRAIDPGPPEQAASHRHDGRDVSRWWRDYLLPSVGDLIFVVFLLALATGTLAIKMLHDAGIGWHIRTGELILASKSVPHVDPFSSTMHGQPWYAWEWLYDVAVGLLHRVAGLNGVVFFSALAIAATFAFAFRRMTARGTGVLLAVGLVLIAAVASSVHFLARPHVFSWLLTLIWFETLRDYETDGNVQRLLWLPAITLIWVNVHGGFLVGFVLLGAYCLALVLDRIAKGNASTGNGSLGKSSLQKAQLLAVTGTACAVVTLVNPYGFRLHEHIYRYLTDRFLMDHIDEFLSPNFHGLPQKFFAIIILLAIITATVARRRIALSELLVILFAVYSGLYATRNIPVSALLLALIVGPHLSRTLEKWSPGEGVSNAVTRCAAAYLRFEQRMTPLEIALKGHWLPLLAVLFGGWVCLQGGRFSGSQFMNAHFDTNRFPKRAVDWLENERVQEPIFCIDSWGGYVIYREFPKLQVVVDDRHDLYGAEYLKNYLKIIRVEPGWDQALEGTHASWLLLPSQSAAGTLLHQVPMWRVLYEDKTAVVFHRVN
jgi:hypothetical protein